MMQKLTFHRDDGTKTAFGIEELAFLFHNYPKEYEKFMLSLIHMGVMGPSEKLEISDKVFDFERDNF